MEAEPAPTSLCLGALQMDRCTTLIPNDETGEYPVENGVWWTVDYLQPDPNREDSDGFAAIVSGYDALAGGLETGPLSGRPEPEARAEMQMSSLNAATAFCAD